MVKLTRAYRRGGKNRRKYLVGDAPTIRDHEPGRPAADPERKQQRSCWCAGLSETQEDGRAHKGRRGGRLGVGNPRQSCLKKTCPAGARVEALKKENRKRDNQRNQKRNEIRESQGESHHTGGMSGSMKPEDARGSKTQNPRGDGGHPRKNKRNKS